MRHLSIQNNRGETLVEVLASILIVTLSVMLLVGSVMASSRADGTAEKLDTAHYNALSEADAQKKATSSPAPTSGIVTISSDSVPDVELDISIYGGEGMYSYERYE